MSECPNCGDEGATETVTINNSKFVNNSYLTEKDVPFEVDFGGHPDDGEMEVVSVSVCEECYHEITS